MNCRNKRTIVGGSTNKNTIKEVNQSFQKKPILKQMTNESVIYVDEACKDTYPYRQR